MSTSGDYPGAAAVSAAVAAAHDAEGAGRRAHGGPVRRTAVVCRRAGRPAGTGRRTITTVLRALVLGVAGTSLLALAAPAAHAQPGVAAPLVVQDDAELLNRTPDRVRHDLEVARDLGVGVVRLTASWSRIAPDPQSTTKPGGAFRADDPATYAPGAWDHLDVAVREAHRVGLRVLVDVAFWAPRWAVARDSPDRDRPRLRPDPGEFAAFATAVARRYDGTAEGSDGQPLPRVDLFATWNEPNHPAFLSPQWQREGSGYNAESADVYRAMHEAAAPAIRRASAGATVLLGNLTSIGGPDGQQGVPPLRFLRRLACVDDDLRPVRDGACRDFRPVTADGLAFHPYTRYVTPGTPAVGRDRVQLADQAKLQDLLLRLRSEGRIVLGHDHDVPAPVWITEYGYEAREDDPTQPFTRADQARFVGWSSYLAWHSPGVVSAAQFLIRDIDPAETKLPADDRRRYRDWQSGVLDRTGAPKPAAGALALPFWPRLVGSGATRRLWVFAQVRRGTGPQTIQVQRWNRDDDAWDPVALHPCGTPRPGCGGPGDGDPFSGPVHTDPQGVTVRSGPPMADAGDQLRMLWLQPDGSWLAGPPITVVADRPA